MTIYSNRFLYDMLQAVLILGVLVSSENKTSVVIDIPRAVQDSYRSTLVCCFLSHIAAGIV